MKPRARLYHENDAMSLLNSVLESKEEHDLRLFE